jgi:hypothetical protein
MVAAGRDECFEVCLRDFDGVLASSRGLVEALAERQVAQAT